MFSWITDITTGKMSLKPIASSNRVLHSKSPTTEVVNQQQQSNNLITDQAKASTPSKQAQLVTLLSSEQVKSPIKQPKQPEQESLNIDPALLSALQQLEYFEENMPEPLKKHTATPLLDPKVFSVLPTQEKMDQLVIAINHISTTLQNKFVGLQLAMIMNDEGIFTRLKELESANDATAIDANKIAELEEKNLRLEEDNALLKGVVQVQDRKISTLQKQVLDLRARSMANNLVISGITGNDENENCKEKVESFIRTKLKKEIKDSDVKIAHRLGKKKEGVKPRSMVAKVSPELRHSIFMYTKNLKGQKNELKDYYYVDPQLPEEMSAKRCEVNYEIKKVKDQNLTLNDEQKLQYKVQDQELIVNGAPRKNPFSPPTAADILSLSKKEMDRILDIPVQEMEMVAEKGSVFYGYASNVQTRSQVRELYTKIKLWHPEPDHVVMISQVEGQCHGCDDEKSGDSLKLCKWLDSRGTKQVAIFIAREYGLTRLGVK